MIEADFPGIGRGVRRVRRGLELAEDAFEIERVRGQFEGIRCTRSELRRGAGSVRGRAGMLVLPCRGCWRSRMKQISLRLRRRRFRRRALW